MSNGMSRLSGASGPAAGPSLAFPVGLEEGPDGTTRVHALELLGCAAEGASTELALEAFTSALADWLHFLGAAGEPVPAADAELEIRVEEWLRTDADVLAGQSDVCFEADMRPLRDAEIQLALCRFGDLRGRLLRTVRRTTDQQLDAEFGSGWSACAMLDELARAEWWTLTRLGSSPLAEVPERTLGRLDTAAALVIARFTELPSASRANVIDIEGETWTPRKVLRRLLWLEWSLGGAVVATLSRLLAHTETRP